MNMRIGSDPWRQLIVQGAAEFGIVVTPSQAEQFARHAALLLEWNRKTNLTTIVDPAQVAVKHYLDSLIPLNDIPSDGPLLDLGTGAGFPGIVLKIMRPDQPMTLIDGSRKKISFVKTIIRQLALPRTEAIHARAEEIANQLPSYRGFFKVVVSRAVGDIVKVARCTQGLIAPSGQIFLYQGPSEAAAENPLDGDSVFAGRRWRSVVYQLPCLGDRRRLLIVDARP